MPRKFLLATIFLCSATNLASAETMTANKLAKSGTFSASGTVRCAQEVGETLGLCQADVARFEDEAVVVVRFLNGFARTLMFADQKFLRGNATMSGVGTDTAWQLSDGIFEIRVDDQRFDILETLVFGR